MTLSSTASSRLTNLLRQYGVDGETAFYVLSYMYLRAHSLEEEFQRITDRVAGVIQRVEGDQTLRSALEAVVQADKSGDELPSWYQHFVGRRFRRGSGKFFTPRPVARSMASLLPRIENAVIMDPTCGGGTFLREASRRWQDLWCTLVGNDIEESLVVLSSVVLALETPVSHKKVYLNENIYSPTEGFRVWTNRVDFILANPPFSLPVESVQTDSSLYQAGFNTSDALFLDVCLDLLKPGGRLVCLLPHSLIANTEYRKFRTLVEDRWELAAVIGLPEGVFYLAADAASRADIVVLERRGSTADRHRVVFAFAPSVGVRLNGRTRDPLSNSLAQIVDSDLVRQALGTQVKAGVRGGI
jgi:type I restriction-modification system DNA methylase subunit